MSDAAGPLVAGTLEVLAATPAAMHALLETLPEHVVTRPADDGWSPRDVLAHVCSVEPWALAHRVRLMVEADQPAIPNIDESDALDRSGFRARPVAWLLGEFARARADNLAWVRGLTPDQLERSGRHEQLGMISVANVLHHIAFHDLNHIRQIAAALEPPYDAGRGAMRDAY